MAKLRHKLIGLKRQCGKVSLNYLLLILSCPKNGDETEAERLFYRFLDVQRKKSSLWFPISTALLRTFSIPVNSFLIKATKNQYSIGKPKPK